MTLDRFAQRAQEGGSDIDELAARIRAQGLLQNLVGFEQRKKNKETGKIEIVAGGRRLEALNFWRRPSLSPPTIR